MRTLLLASALLLAAFAPPASAASTHPEWTAISHPTGASKVVLRVTTGGGFVAPQTRLREMPSFTLYGDGTVIVAGAVAQIYPGPAVYPLVRSTLSERGVQALLERARAAGLLARGTVDYGDVGAMGITDMPTTALLVNANGRHILRAAYALGATAHGGRLTAAQARARKALAGFIAKLPQRLAGATFTPRAIAVYVAPSSGKAQSGSKRIAWPLTSDLATLGKPSSSDATYRCAVVSGEHAKVLLTALGKANELSRWTGRAAGTGTFEVIVRPLLPDERGCA